MRVCHTCPPLIVNDCLLRLKERKLTVKQEFNKDFTFKVKKGEWLPARIGLSHFGDDKICLCDLSTIIYKVF